MELSYTRYVLPLFGRLLSFFRSTPRPKINDTYSFGRLSIPLNIIDLVHVLSTNIHVENSGAKAVTSGNMDYLSAAVVTWFPTGHRRFNGPESGGIALKGGEVGVIANVEDEVACDKSIEALEI